MTTLSDDRRRRSGLVSLAISVGVAGAYGLLSSRLPAPDDPTVFWIANLAAPYVVMPFVAGRLQAVGVLLAIALLRRGRACNA